MLLARDAGKLELG